MSSYPSIFLRINQDDASNNSNITKRLSYAHLCRRDLDQYGDHRAACNRSGRLKIRSAAIERMWARVCREGGARVQENVFLRDMNLPGISSADGRRLEVVANGLPTYHGVQLAIDATIVSPLRADGRPTGASERRDGWALTNAIRRKESTYPELVDSRRCHLLVAAVETGGRWNEETYRFIVQLAKAKTRSSPMILRSSLTNAWIRRWTGMLAFAVHDALAASLVEDVPKNIMGTDGPTPTDGLLLEADAAADHPGFPCEDPTSGELLTTH